MITMVGDSRKEILRDWVSGGVLLGWQRRERRLLRMALSGYASVYNVNTCLQLDGEYCRWFAQGARG